MHSARIKSHTQSHIQMEPKLSEQEVNIRTNVHKPKVLILQCNRVYMKIKESQTLANPRLPKIRRNLESTRFCFGCPAFNKVSLVKRIDWKTIILLLPLKRWCLCAALFVRMLSARHSSIQYAHRVWSSQSEVMFVRHAITPNEANTQSEIKCVRSDKWKRVWRTRREKKIKRNYKCSVQFAETTHLFFLGSAQYYTHRQFTQLACSITKSHWQRSK